MRDSTPDDVPSAVITKSLGERFSDAFIFPSASLALTLRTYVTIICDAASSAPFSARAEAITFDRKRCASWSTRFESIMMSCITAK